MRPGTFSWLIAVALAGCHDARARGALPARCDAGSCEAADAQGETPDDGDLPADGATADATGETPTDGDADLRDADLRDAEGLPLLPDGGFRWRESSFKHVAPRVVIAGETPEFRAYGELLRSADRAPVFVDGRAAGSVRATADGVARFTLDGPLDEGEHLLEIGAPNVDGRDPVAVLVVPDVAPPPEAAIPLPDYAREVVEDPERHALYVTSGSKLLRLRNDALRLASSELTMPAEPIAAALSPDGGTLYVVLVGCHLVEIDTDSFTRRGIVAPLPDCLYGALSSVRGLADGRVLLDRDVGPSADRHLLYPQLDPLPAPDAYYRVFRVSRDLSHLYMLPTQMLVQGPVFYLLEAGQPGYAPFHALGFGPIVPAFALSAHGDRVSHSRHVYDAAFNFLGSLASDLRSINAVGLSGDGRLAVDFSQDDRKLHAYDLTMQETFPEIWSSQKFAVSDGEPTWLWVDHAGSFAVVFLSHVGSIAGDVRHAAFVRKIAKP